MAKSSYTSPAILVLAAAGAGPGAVSGPTQPSEREAKPFSGDFEDDYDDDAFSAGWLDD